MGISVVLFDIGSTLIDGPGVSPGTRLAEELGLGTDVVPDLSRRLFTSSFCGPAGLAKELATHYCVDLSSAARVVDEIWRSQVAEAYPIAGAAQAVERVASAGWRVAYVSNIWQPFFEGFLRCFPRKAQGYPCYLSFQLGLSKPERGIFEAALAGCGCRPDEAVMIGDTYKNDIVPAMSLGMKTVWLLHRPNKEVHDLAEVINGTSAPPDLTLATISGLEPGHLLELGRGHRHEVPGFGA